MFWNFFFFSVVWISLWYMVGLFLFLGKLVLGVLHFFNVKVNSGLHFAVKGMEKNALAMSMVVYYFVALDFSSYWSFSMSGMVVLSGGVTVFKLW